MRLDGEDSEEVKKFKYLGLTGSASGEMEVEVSHRLNEGAMMTGSLGSISVIQF